MPMRVACRCGASFNAPDHLAGRTVKCPKCSQPLAIPAAAAPASPPPLADLLDEAGLKDHGDVARCPSCHKPMAPDAVVCVACGFNRQTGRRLVTRVGHEAGGHDEDDDFADLPRHGVAALDKAERDLARAKSEQARLKKGTPWWVYFVALLMLVGFAVGMVSLPQDQVMRWSGMTLLAAGSLMSTYFGIRMVIVAFSESTLQGLLYLLVPIYPLYYVITRWERCGSFFVMSLLGSGVAGAGYALVLFGPAMARSSQEANADRAPGTVAVASLESPGFVASIPSRPFAVCMTGELIGAA